MIFRKKPMKTKAVVKRAPPSEAETLDRIERVTDRLEWLAKEIEYQLQQNERSDQ